MMQAGGGTPWGSIAQFGAQLIGGLFQARASRSVARAQNRIAEAENIVRVAQNEATVSRNSLMATVKGLNNQRMMEQAGKDFNAASTNIQRMAEGFAQGNFESIIRGAELMGSLVASGVTSGASPGATAGAEYSAALQQGRAMTQANRSQERSLYDSKLQAAGIMSNAFTSLDRSNDYGIMDQYRAIGTAQGQSNFAAILGAIDSNKDSLHTILGSLGGSNAPVTNPVSRGTVIGTNLGTLNAATPNSGATAYPVTSNWVDGVPLQSLPAIKFQSQVKGM